MKEGPGRRSRGRGLHHQRRRNSPVPRTAAAATVAPGTPSNDPSHKTEATAAKGRSLLRAEILASLGAAGTLLYVALRYPYAIYYDRLGTTPEEVGLGYAQLLAQSSALVVVVAGAVTAFSAASAMVALTLSVLPELRSRVLPTGTALGSPEQLVRLTDAEFAKHLHDVREVWADRPRLLLALDGGILSVTARLRELSRKEVLSAAEMIERHRLLHRWPRAPERAGARALVRGTPLKRWLMWSFVFWSLIIMLVYLPDLAVRSADVVLNQCRDPASTFRFDLSRPVEVLDANGMSPQFAERELLLLGGDSSKYILFDCRSDSALRVPTSNYVVVNR